MTAEENIKLLNRFLSITWADGGDSVLMRPEGDDRVDIFVILNDVFDWACSDVEQITPANVIHFEEAYREVKALDFTKDNFQVCHDAGVLFACRIRQQRPFKHKDAYPVHKSLWPLIESLPYPVRKP